MIPPFNDDGYFLPVYTPLRWLRSMLASDNNPNFAVFRWNRFGGLLIWQAAPASGALF
jgi:hypothetical protein